jgi:hypothetical protein
MKLEVKQNCPLNNFEPCKQFECGWFLKIDGVHPSTGEKIEDWGCAIAWLPIMLIENAKQQKSTSVAVESFRNEMVKNNEVGQRVLLAASGVSQQAQKMILES